MSAPESARGAMLEELLGLYELALSIGEHLDPRATVRHFLKVLIGRRNLCSAEVWWLNPAADGLGLLDALPRLQADAAGRPLTHPMWQRVASGRPLVVRAGDAAFAELAAGSEPQVRAIALYPLGQGVLLMRSAAADVFTPRMLSQLRAVFGKLATAVRGGLAHERLMLSEAELQAKSEALKESQLLLQSVIDAAPLRVFWKDRESRYLGANPPFARDAGLASPSELLGRDDHALGWRDQAAAYRADDRRVMESGEARLGYEEPQTTPDGGQIWLRTSKVPLRNGRQEVIGVLGIYEDITERKRTEEALKQAASVFACANEAIMITAPDGRILDVNPGFSEITGFSRDEAVGSKPRLLNSGCHDAAFYAEMWRAIARHGRWSGEVWNRRKNGELFVARQTISAMRDGSGQIERYVALFSDHTVLREQRTTLERLVETRTQDLLVAKEAAEAANRAKSTFLANMSHELRTPMNGVLGMIGIARRRVADAQVAEQLAKAENSAQRLLGVLNDILDLSKIEADRLTLEAIPFTLGQLADNLSALLLGKAREKGLGLQIAIAPELAGRGLLGDPLRLGQVLINLAGNAIKFSQRGIVRVAATLLAEDDGAALLRFAVSDEGIGIAQADQARLFVAFEQADGSMTRRYGGTGLGLAISRHLVHMMGGEIGVSSAPGVGSTFWFTARLAGDPRARSLAPAPNGALAAEQALAGRHRGARVLVAEDEPISAEIVASLLADVGLEVALAEDGEAALGLAQLRDFDLILMDMQMPRLNGLDATRAIRAASRNRTTPIVAMTANAFEQDRQRCLAAGMNDHLAKPLSPESLYACILGWLEGPQAAL